MWISGMGLPPSVAGVDGNKTREGLDSRPDGGSPAALPWSRPNRSRADSRLRPSDPPRRALASRDALTHLRLSRSMSHCGVEAVVLRYARIGPLSTKNCALSDPDGARGGRGARRDSRS